ncbi:hypothetical protein HME01_06420 [Vreelandella aquamarina]|jgi:uncharacterized membrane protein YciS (DUF1049 family)|uniref:Uncharacterized protein n=1 Tax=Vreelandella aquamarina TaxID=77097 RepID=A0A1N6G399_9GAMM|nr:MULTISPECIES: hypothetical protein [Halomonas]SEN30880.1 hypothetical protein SAMN04490369_100743 [Halomonas aquamarina]SIN60909.1 hypothetical protein SAMN05878249_0406 [Halomonas meridiana]SIN65762.1 hypothetical protein SAMN05878438_1835 [Halomonas meridiana]SIO01983.1 hypothetical protein SAMN05878442_0553 [Halomonas meridiana]GED44790.1 hypothetical protein HME01_06420 [Halomonas meridiana]
MLKRPWLFIVLVAMALAGLFSQTASHEPFEETLVRLEVERALPALEPTFQEESAEINALFLHYASDQALWMSAALAILRHGDIARSTLLDYGLSPQFQQVLVRFGADAVLPISYFRDHDVTTLRAQHWIGVRYQQVSRWWGDEPSDTNELGDADVEAAMAELTPLRRGQMGIALLGSNGHGLLNQFVVDDEGNVAWLQGERLVSGVGDFFTSGLRDLESQWRRGEAIGASDLGWAGVDLLVMASAVKVLRAGRAARTARVGSVEAQAARTGVRQGIVATSGRFATLPRMAKVAAVAGTAYVVIRHPSLVSALGANLSQWLGWPTWLGQFLVWLIVLLPVMFIARFIYRWLLTPLLWLLMPLMRVCFKAANRSLGKRTQEQAKELV